MGEKAKTDFAEAERRRNSDLQRRIAEAGAHGRDEKSLSSDTEELRRKAHEESQRQHALSETQRARENQQYQNRLAAAGPTGHDTKTVSASDYLKKVEGR